MANYTVELGEIISHGFKPALNQYPIFNEEYRLLLNDKIINHFWFREIGTDAPDKFNFYLKRKMAEIMPLYNKLYESELIQFEWWNTENILTKEQKAETALDRKSAVKSSASTTGENTASEVIQNFDENLSANTTGENEYIKGETLNVSETGTSTNDDTSTQTNNLNENIEGNTTTNNTNTTNTTSISNEIRSDLPQASVSDTLTINADGSASFSVNGYATTSTKNNEKSNSSATGNETVTNEQSKTNTGTVHNDRLEKINTTFESDTTHGGKNSENLSTNTNTETNRTITGSSESNNKSITSSGEKNVESNVNELSGTLNTITTGNRNKSIQELLIEYRNSIINIDMLIIDELEVLFMEVYN